MTAASFLTKNVVNKAGKCAENRILWDKSMSGANYFRYNIISWDEAICKFCQNKLETNEHKITECREEHCVELREAALKEFEDKMIALSTTKLARTVQAMKLYLRIFKEVNSGLAWLGLWFGDQAIRIRNAIDSASLTIKQYRILRNSVKKLSEAAIKIIRAHDIATVVNDIRDEQVPGLPANLLQERVNKELSRGQLLRLANRKIRVNKKMRWDNYVELGKPNKKTKTKDDSDDESQRDNNQKFCEVLMTDPFDFGPLEMNELSNMERMARRPEDWENWKKKKR
jgi:hypothetical protein